MTTPKFESFEEFWPFYVREHSKKATRVLHFIGTSAALATLATASATRSLKLLTLVPLFGYGPAWFSHFFIERNKPATFHHPRWSLRADLRMFGKMLDGSMDAEVERYTKQHAPRAVEADVEADVEAERKPSSGNGASNPAVQPFAGSPPRGDDGSLLN